MRTTLATILLLALSACAEDDPVVPEFQCNSRASADSFAADVVTHGITAPVTLTFDSVGAVTGEYPFRRSHFWYTGRSGDTLNLRVNSEGNETVDASEALLCLWGGGWMRLPPYATQP